MRSQPNLRLSKTKRARRAFGVLIFAASVVTAPTIGVGLGHIIFDPSNFTKNVEQVVALLQQIERAAEQLRQQRQMLAHLPASVLEALALAERSLDSQLDQLFGDPTIDTASVQAQVESWYPIAFQHADSGWLDVMRPIWMEVQRQQVLKESDLVQHITNDMAPTADLLATLVEASNGINADPNKLPGIVATAQAHEEMLAIASGEVDKLLAIRAARAKRQVEIYSQAHSESAYRNVRRNDLLNDWTTPGHAVLQAIRNPFLKSSKVRVAP